MRTTQWMTSLFLATSLCAATAIAADAAPAAGQAQKEAKLETISGTAADKHDDCPMQQSKKECQHKHGEPCPHHQEEIHHSKSHEKCDHKHPG